MSFVENMRRRIEGLDVESCCDGGRLCPKETEGVDLHPNADGCLVDGPDRNTCNFDNVTVNLSEAKTYEDRGKIYGDAAINNNSIGLQWTALLRNAFQTEEIPVIPGWLVALMMSAMKLNRLAKTPTHEDSDHDARVYLSISKEII